VWMLRNIVTFFEEAQKAVAESSGDMPITWNTIQMKIPRAQVMLQEMKFRKPTEGEAANVQYFRKQNEDIVAMFASLSQ
jgi:V-type H+-transporting ATPase subunit A